MTNKSVGSRGRPSVAEARRRQILDATVRCMSTHGLGGTTLDRIAASAGMARGHVRHFAGNRDEILIAAAVLLYFGEVPQRGVDPIEAHGGSFLPSDTATMSAALDYLFGDFALPGPENVAALAFVEAARTSAEIRAVIVHAYRSSESEFRRLLAVAAPTASADDVTVTAYGVLTIALGNVFMSDLEGSAERSVLARHSAEALIDRLGGCP